MLVFRGVGIVGMHFHLEQNREDSVDQVHPWPENQASGHWDQEKLTNQA